ncbi:MAG TPA: ABC transporter substrate-binding protein [Candidatus Binatia bacterium]|nr:ABC transporter substrate-binding protein [Candidatus Binatia bacterium]
MSRAIVALGALLLVLCSTASPGRSQAPTMLRIAVNPIEVYAQVYYAKEMGFFQKAGLDVDIQPSQSGSAIAAAVVGNAADIGATSTVVDAVAHGKHIPFVVIAPAALYTSAAPTAALFVAVNSPIRKAADLNGKTISVSGLGTVTEYGTRAWIDKNGGDSSTAKFVELAASATTEAVLTGRIDAAYITEPYVSLGKKNLRLLAYVHDAIAKQFLLSTWVTTTQWAKDHPDLVNRFAAVMRETAIWANRNPDKSGEILVKYVKIDPALLATMNRARFAERLTPALMQPPIDVAAKYAKFDSFPATELIYSPSR